MSIRPVKRLIKSKPTLEGAGVHLRRAFGFGNTHVRSFLRRRHRNDVRITWRFPPSVAESSIT
jgi:hypothetical protein